MNSNRKRSALLLTVVLGLVIAACGGETTTTTSMGTAEEHDGAFSFGEPADTSEATRVIEIDANDDFSFNPSEISVTAGEIVTFRVTNTGVLPHDFTLGDLEAQNAHDAEMLEMMESGEMNMHDEDNAIALDAGETKDLTWHFSESGNLLMGCHQAGHYAAGMKGTLTVNG